MKRKLFLFCLALFLFCFNGFSIQSITDDDPIYDWIDSKILKGLSDYNIPAISFSFIKKDSLNYIKTYGIQNIDDEDSVDNSSVFHVASISKTVVAVAIMQLVEQKKLNLDSNINLYVNNLNFDAFERPITIRNLLQHTAGFDERNLYTTVLDQEKVISLEKHLRERMPPQIRQAGEVYTYSNYGFALLGLIVQNVSGLEINEYVTKFILNPLEMYNSGFKEHSNLNYVPSYLQKGNDLILYKKDYPLNYPASSFSTTSKDMANYMSFLINDGTFNERKILSKESISILFNSEFKHFNESDSGYSFGFFTSFFKGFEVVGHTGVKQGFASDLTLIPELGIGMFICVNASSYPNSNTRKFINVFKTELLDQLVQAKSESENEVVVNESEISLFKFKGNYRFTRYAQTTLDKLGVLIGLAPEIEVTVRNNKLSISKWDMELEYINENTFYDSKKEKYISFNRDEKGNFNYLFSSGINAYHKIKWFEKVSIQIYWIGTIVFFMILSFFMNLFILIFKKEREFKTLYRIELVIASTIVIGLVLLGYVLISTDPQQFVYGVPMLLKIALIFPFITILFQLINLKYLLNSWKKRKMQISNLLFHSVLFCISICIIPWWIYWNLLGFNN